MRKKIQICAEFSDKYSMNRRATAPAGQNTFEEERNEAIECAMNGVTERPGDRVTRSACAYLLRHLARENPERAVHGLVPGA